MICSGPENLEIYYRRAKRLLTILPTYVVCSFVPSAWNTLSSSFADACWFLRSHLNVTCPMKPSLSLFPKLCPILCNPVDCSRPGSSVHGVSQARKLEWVAISFFRGSSQPRDWTQVSCVSCISRQILDHWATWEALKPSLALWMWMEYLCPSTVHLFKSQLLCGCN